MAQMGFTVVAKVGKVGNKVGIEDKVGKGGKLEGNVGKVGNPDVSVVGSGTKVVVIDGIIVVVTGAKVVVNTVVVVVEFVGNVSPG